MSDHICTTDSLVAGGDKIEFNCLYCESKQTHIVSVGGSKCLNCGLYMYDFDDFTDLLPMLMKKYDIKTKKQIGIICELNMKDIYRYTDYYLGVSIMQKFQIKEVADE